MAHAPYLRFWPIVLLLLCAALYLPGQTQLPPMDRDEARFAQATKQMIASGDYIDIRFQDEPRHKKPVGIYWLQALSVTLANAPETIAAYRVPSWLGAFMAVLFTAGFLRQSTRAPHLALAGGAMLASTLLLVTEAHLAKTDGALLGLICGMQYCLYQSLAARERRLTWTLALFWLFLGLGILIKGPIAPLAALLTLLMLRYWFQQRGVFRAVWHPLGLLLMLGVIAPWFVMIHLKSGGAFWYEAVVVDLLSKAASGQESHGGLPGYYLMLSPLLFWPWGFAVILALTQWRRIRDIPAARFAAAWALPTWLLFEAMPTKLPHYVLPAFPALIILVILAWQASAAAFFAARWQRLVLAAYGILSAAVLLAPVVALPLALKVPFDALMLLPALLCVGLIVYAYRNLLKSPHPSSYAKALADDLSQGRGDSLPHSAAALPILVAAALFYLGLFFIHVPNAQPLWVSPRLSAALPEGAPVFLSGFSEPSAIFLIGTATDIGSGADAAMWLRQNPSGIAVVEARQEEAFRSAAAGINVETIGNASGLNYSNGRWVTLTLWRIKP